MIRALYEDADGVLWIGTYDGGLARFHDGKFTHFTTRDGLFNGGVFQILEDGRGNLWMSSNRGISRVSKHALNARAAGDPTRLNTIAYGRDDGMLNIECNGGLWPAGIEARDGTLWFPDAGRRSRDRSGVDPCQPEAPTSRDRIRARRPRAHGLRAGRRRRSHRTGRDGDRDRLHRPELSQRRSDPLPVQARRTRSRVARCGNAPQHAYSHLPAGDYVFRVTAANSDGVWNDTGQTLRIIVTPPFYRRAWFLLLMLATVAGAAIVWHHRRLARVRAAHAAQADFSRRLLASQEQERKRIAGELHDSLGQQLLVIRNRAVLGDTVADDPTRSRGQFDEIVASATAAIAEVMPIAHNLRPVHLDRLGLTASIEEMVETMASATGLQFSADIEPLDGLLSKDEEITCYRIIQESANNIVKHAAATKAYVEIWRENDALRITVRDNGRGVEGSAARPGRGLGLTSITERLRLLGGSLTIDSAPGQGTALEMQVPLSRRTSGGGVPPGLMMTSRITVLIADDHPIFRRGLQEIIEAAPGLRLVAAVEDGERAWDAIQRDRPRVAVLDVDMPRKDGLGVTRAVKEARLDVAVVLLTMHRSERLFNTALDIGVDGYVLKDSAIAEIVSAIEATASGQRYVTPLLTGVSAPSTSRGVSGPGTGSCSSRS